MLHVIALGHYAVAYTRAWAVNGRIARVRLKAENDELRQQVALLTEEICIKDARLRRIDLPPNAVPPDGAFRRGFEAGGAGAEPPPTANSETTGTSTASGAGGRYDDDEDGEFDDSITTTDKAVLEFLEPPSLFRLNSNMEVTEGTGDFEGVRGRLHAHGEIDLAVGWASFEISGVVCD
jgi:hypothetical protein